MDMVRYTSGTTAKQQTNVLRRGSRWPIALKASAPARAAPPKTPYMSPSSAALPYSSSREDRHDDGERRVEEIRDHDCQHDCAEEALVPDEAQPFLELGEEPARLLLGRLLRGPRDEEGDERGRDEEAGGVEPQRVRRAERGHEHAAQRCADEDRSLLDARPDPARPLQAHPRLLRDIRQERRPRGRAGCIEQRAEEDERHQLPELDPDGRVQERDRGDGRRAGEIGDDTRRPEPEPIHDDPAEERGEDDREEIEEDGERGQLRAAGRRQHEPRDRELRDGVPGERDHVRGVERVERRPPHARAG